VLLRKRFVVVLNRLQLYVILFLHPDINAAGRRNKRFIVCTAVNETRFEEHLQELGSRQEESME
jgi:hypothetical protein